MAALSVAAQQTSVTGHRKCKENVILTGRRHQWQTTVWRRGLSALAKAISSTRGLTLSRPTFAVCVRTDVRELQMRISILLIMLTGSCLALSACDEESEEESGENTWTDPASGLTWMNPTESPRKEWYEAEQYCADLEFGGSTDWRLPTIYELRSLVRGCPATQAGGTCNIDEDSCLAFSCWGDSCNCKMDSCGDNHCSYRDGPATGGGTCQQKWDTFSPHLV